jgi:hypothetical protein
MVYCMPIETYPTEGLFIEENLYFDENNFEWRIARVNNGFFVKYFGDGYFKDEMFCCELKDGKTYFIKNTNCIFFQDPDFETFVEMRDILKNGFTDDIWESIEMFLTERLNICTDILECEWFK